MKTIYKYGLQITDLQELEMPKHAKLLSVQFQGDTLCLWALVDNELPSSKKVIEIFCTGNPIVDTPREFIGTVQQMYGLLVWHVFERII